MAQIGLRYPIVAEYDEATGTYKNGKVIGKAIKEDIQITVSNVELWADDEIGESDKGFSKGSGTVNLDDLSDEIQAMLLGHKLDAESKELVAGRDDVAPFVGHGFYAPKRVNNVNKYRAIFLPKVQFAIPGITGETKGETVAFQTPSLTYTVYTDKDGNWKKESTFDTAEEAVAYLKEKAGMNTPQS